MADCSPETQLRTAFAAAISADDIRALARVLYAKALEGNLTAAKLILPYVMGKPGKAPVEKQPSVEKETPPRDTSWIARFMAGELEDSAERPTGLLRPAEVSVTGNAEPRTPGSKGPGSPPSAADSRNRYSPT